MNDENKIIIECLNTFGRVPEQWELLKMIKQLQSNWNSLKEELYQANRELVPNELVNGKELINNILDKMNKLERRNEKIMEFEISRTSLYYGMQPCEEAYKKEIIRIDERGFKTFEEHDQRLPKDKKWLEEGFNHKIVPPNEEFNKVHIYREFNDKIWCIKINSLEELLKLQDKYGNIVLTKSCKNKNIRELEIYDYWRE